MIINAAYNPVAFLRVFKFSRDGAVEMRGRGRHIRPANINET